MTLAINGTETCCMPEGCQRTITVYGHCMDTMDALRAVLRHNLTAALSSASGDSPKAAGDARVIGAVHRWVERYASGTDAPHVPAILAEIEELLTARKREHLLPTISGMINEYVSVRGLAAVEADQRDLECLRECHEAGTACAVLEA
jgi:hypothetical protein